jgi:high affinity choline transporter 7
LVVQLACIAAFYALIFGVGWYAGRRRLVSDRPQGWMLADRRIPLVVGVFTLTATWVGGGYINGTAEAVYDPQQGFFWAQAPWGYALSLILGGLFFAGRMRRLGFTTMVDVFEVRYGRGVGAGLFVPALLGEVFWSGAILVALGTTFAAVLQLDLTTSILISAAVAVAYTAVGGLWSVAYTDVAQLVCILVGLSIAIPFAAGRCGGAERVWQAYVEQMPAFPRGTATWLWFDMALLLMLGGIPWQVYFQRVLASPTARAAARLSVLAGFGCLAMAVPAVMIGAIGAVADWPGVGQAESPPAALILPYVLRDLTPPAVATIGLAAVAAAVMSSVDSSVLSASSMFVWNVYRPLVRPQAENRELQRVLRAAIIVVGVAATALALSVQRIYPLWFLCSDLVYAVLFPQLVMALFDRRANRCGAIAGAAVSLFLRLGGGEPLLGLPSFLPYPLQTPEGCHFPFRTFAMLSGLLSIWLVSRATARFDPPRSLPSADGNGC